MGVDPGGTGRMHPPWKMWGYKICYIPPSSRPTTGYKYQICCHHMGILSSSECTQTCFRPRLRPGPSWRSLRRSPKPPSRLGEGDTPHHSGLPRRLRHLDLAAIPLSSKRNLNQCKLHMQWLRHLDLAAIPLSSKRNLNQCKLHMQWRTQDFSMAWHGTMRSPKGQSSRCISPTANWGATRRYHTS